MADETQNIIVRVLSESELNELNNELAKTQQELAEMAIAGKEGTDEFDKLNKKATELRQTLKEQSKATDELTKAQDKQTESTKKAGDEAQKTTEKKKSLKAELRELKAAMAEMADAGEADSAVFREMAMRAGQLEDTIGDTGGQIRALASDTRALDTGIETIGLLANSFAAAQSVTAIFTKDSEKLQQAFQKAQSAMALVASVQQIVNALQKEGILITNLQAYATQAYTYVTNGATLATKAFRATLVTTGVGALVVAFGFLVSKLFEYDEAATDAKDSVDALEEANKKLQDSLKPIQSNIDITILRLKSQGASQKELDDATIKGANEIIKKTKEKTDELNKETAKQVEDRIMQEAKGDKVLEAQLRNREAMTGQYLDEQKKINQAFYRQIETEKLNAEIAITEIEIRAREDRKNKSDKYQEEQKRQLMEWEKMKKESLNNILLMDLNGLAKELEQIDQSFEQRLEAAKGNEDLYQILLDELRKTRLAKIKEFNDKEAQANQEKCDAELEQEKALQNAILDLRLKAYNQKKQADKDARDEEVNLIQDTRQKRKAEYENQLADLKDAKLNELFEAIQSKEYQSATEQEKAEILSNISDSYRTREKTLSQAFSNDMVLMKYDEKKKQIESQLWYAEQLNMAMTGLFQMLEGFGKQDEESQRKRFEWQKRVNIAMTLIDTYLAAQKAYNSQIGSGALGDPTAPFRAAIAAGVAIAAGLGRVAMIKAQTFQGSGSGSTGGGGGMATGGGGNSGSQPSGMATNPNMTQLDANGRPINTGSNGGNQPQPMRAYIVENDIRVSTKRLNTIAQQATLQ